MLGGRKGRKKLSTTHNRAQRVITRLEKMFDAVRLRRIVCMLKHIQSDGVRGANNIKVLVFVQHGRERERVRASAVFAKRTHIA